MAQPRVLTIDFPITPGEAVNEIELGGATPTGTGLLTLDRDANVLSWFISYDGLTGTPTAMHFHGTAAAGQAAGVDFGIDEFGDNSSSGSAILTAEQEADLRAGLWYLNIHTAANPGGEIRGQAVAKRTVKTFDFPITAAQSVHELELGEALPRGSAVVTYSPETLRLKWMIAYSDLTGSPSAMHFHGPAAAGEAAGVDLGIDAFDDAASVGTAILNTFQESDLLAGLWYLNIHTAANPAGEIRGQVVDQPDRWLFDFPITSDQSVHEIELGEAAPSGTGLVTYDTRTGSVDWFITYEGLTGPPTAMHFHGLAAPGQAAGVDLGISEFGEDSSAGSASLTAEQAADLRAGLWYLNIHTAANPAGEIRGQVVPNPGIFVSDFPIGITQVVNELDVGDSTPCGDGLVTYDSEASLLKWRIQYRGLTGPATAMHFHGPASVGQATGVAFGIDILESPSRGSAIIAEEDATDLLAGLWYLNIHTAANPAGEIRGQVGEEEEPIIYDFPVTTSQPVNALDLGSSTPSGSARVTYNARTRFIRWSISYDGLTGPPTAMHFHGLAMVGEPAGVDFGISEFDDSSSTGSGTLTPEQGDSLTTGFWYLNIHTAANRAGEIRGQVVDRPQRLVIDFPITTGQVVNDLDLNFVIGGSAMPSGEGLVIYERETNFLWWSISYEGLTRNGPPTAMHFHGPAATGQATGVDLGIGEFGESSSVGSATITEEQAATLEAGLWYLNIHTSRNPAGEIRGQVVSAPAILVYDFPVEVDQVVNELDLGEAEPSGRGYAAYNPETSLLKWLVTWKGLTGPVTKMHFHGPAQRGEATGVDLGIDDLESPSVGSAILTPEQEVLLRAGLWYLNIHTAANPAGEIRGQVLPAAGGIWDAAEDLSEGWRFLEWFGFFNITHQPWIYHLDHGFLRTVSKDTNSIWFYTTDMGYLWTNSVVYPLYYRPSDSAWISL